MKIKRVALALLTAVFLSTPAMALNTGPANQSYTLTQSGGVLYNGSTAVKTLVQGKNTITITATDVAGNVETKLVDYYYDTIAPTITINSSDTSMTSGDLILNIQASDDVFGIAPGSLEYRKDSGSWKSLPITTLVNSSANGNFKDAHAILNITDSGVYTFRLSDNDGNVGQQSITVTNIDKVKPLITAVAKSSAWTNDGIDIDVSATDDNSGNANIEVSNDNQVTWTPVTTAGLKTLTLSATYKSLTNGTYWFRSTDNVGNVSDSVSVDITTIDKILPVIALSQDPVSDTNGDVKLHAIVTDSGGSLIKTGSLVWSDKPDFSSTTLGEDFTVGNNCTVYFKVEDNAGNLSTQTITVTNVDKILPTITSVITDAPTLNQTKTVTLSANDASSSLYKATGVDETSYEWSENITGPWNNIPTKTFTVANNGTYYYRVKDNVGNVSLVQSVAVTTVDNAKPLINDVSTIGAPEHNGMNRKIRITASDPVTATSVASGINTSTFEYSTSATGPWTPANTDGTFDVSAVGKYYVRVTDNVGNVSDVSSIDMYSVEYHEWDDTLLQAPELAMKGEIVAYASNSPKPFKYGYNFGSWSANGLCDGSDYVIKIKAQYDARVYKIVFKEAYGETVFPLPDGSLEQYVQVGGTIVTPAQETIKVPAKDFTGWDRSLIIDTYLSLPTGTEIVIRPCYTWSKYDVSFLNIDGVEISEYHQTKDSLTTVYMPAVPDLTEQGYTNAHWAPLSVSNGGRTIVYKATYAPIQYTVTFLDASGKTLDVQKVNWGMPAKSPDTSTIKDFKVWNRFIDSVKEDLVCTPICKEPYYLVTFVDINDNAFDKQYVEEGKGAITPNRIPFMKTLKFQGWQESYDCVMSNMRIHPFYASSNNEYVITFIGYNQQTISKVSIAKGSKVTPPKAPVWDADHTFVGWALVGQSDTTDFNKYTVSTNATFRARYNNYFYVNFLNEDDSIISAQTVYKNKAAVLPAEPTKAGYYFDSWDIDTSNVTTDLDVRPIFNKGTKPVYYTVTFEDEDGTVLSTSRVKNGLGATPPTNPSKDGYTFTGWNVDFSCITSDLVVTAVYDNDDPNSTLPKYTVEFVDWDNSTIDTQSIREGKSAIAPANPQRDGYTFSHWSTSFNKVKKDLTVKAIYVEGTGKTPGTTPTSGNVTVNPTDPSVTPGTTPTQPPSGYNPNSPGSYGGGGTTPPPSGDEPLAGQPSSGGSTIPPTPSSATTEFTNPTPAVTPTEPKSTTNNTPTVPAVNPTTTNPYDYGSYYKDGRIQPVYNAWGEKIDPYTKGIAGWDENGKGAWIYDKYGNLIQDGSTLPDVIRCQAYDKDGKMINVYDKQGNMHIKHVIGTQAYDEFGNPIEVYNANGEILTIDNYMDKARGIKDFYDEYGNKLDLYDSYGNHLKEFILGDEIPCNANGEIVSVYDAKGKLIVDKAEYKIIRIEPYDINGNKIVIYDRFGNQHEYYHLYTQVYDQYGNPITVYNANGEVASEKDAIGIGRDYLPVAASATGFNLLLAIATAATGKAASNGTSSPDNAWLYTATEFIRRIRGK